MNSHRAGWRKKSLRKSLIARQASALDDSYADDVNPKSGGGGGKSSGGDD
eukprot:CAMPEP_0168478404 /NCGR_PEP_ID=MMETSP0228-20121227/62934_1 /TAXON_ID=133427 /ORGANISM="Protoceratium reticulatum, Strain CCCM 535 (=CCMP 1889)" /LENGTH=49 /DNA_ID= /DNA_START= /DNA_END= /DNA_ORIENTATION=